MKTRYILYPLLMLLAILLPTSCSFEEDFMDIPTTDGDKISFTMGVSVSGATSAESRAFGAENHNFSDLYVAVFEETDGVSYLKDFVKATASTTANDTEHGCKYYVVELTKSDTPCRVHIIANYPDLNMGINEEGQLMGLLATKGNNQDVYWNFKDLGKIDQSSVTQLQHVSLVRNYVTIKLDATQIASKTNFILDGYALYNVPTKGTVAAYNPSSQTKKFANFVKDGSCQTYLDMLNVEEYEGNEAYDDGTLINTEISWKTPSTISYMYERKNRTAENKTCMLIKGRYVKEGKPTEDTQPTYYKLDFVYQDQNSNSTVYYNLLRNFVYKMQITDVTGSGYSSENDALNAPASNNISGDVVTEDFTNISYANKQLYVSSTYVLFTSTGEINVYYKYISDVNNSTKNNNSNLDNNTETNKPVTITASTGNGSVLNSITVANSDETIGQYEGWRRMTLKPNAIPDDGSSISQEITIAAGGLQRKVELLLRNTLGDLTVTTTETVVKQEKAPLDVTFTLPANVDIPEALFPLRFFIYSDDDTIFPEYGSDLPSESQNKKFGFVKVLTWEEYQDSRTVTCKFITNCAESATTVRVSNLYLTEGNDSFVNANGVVLSSSVPVTIKRINGRYPQNIYNDGKNDGIEQVVTVKNNGKVIGTISINRSNVTSSLAIFEEGIYGDVTFEFEDKYWKGGDSWETITYIASSSGSLYNISNGLTFNPNSTYTEMQYVSLPNNKVEVWKDGSNRNHNPQKLESNGGEISGIITCNGVEVGEFTIIRNGYDHTDLYIKEEVKLYGIVANSDLVFTFEDNYYLGSSRWSSDPVAYTATCKANQLSQVTLYFDRQR